MKRVSCPRCGAYITFNEQSYPEGRILILTCPACKKQFRVRSMASDSPKEDTVYPAKFIVVANKFHERQELKLAPGENIIGRYVKGTNATLPIFTNDPSIDTTHCIVNVTTDKAGKTRFILRDAPSTTGTFYQDQILQDQDRINMDDGAIITIGATTLIFSIN